MMKHFASLPLSARKRTIVVVFTEGHFATQFLPDQAWLKDRPEIAGRALTSIGIEHLGCREWVAELEKDTFTDLRRPDVVWAFCLASPDHPNYQIKVMRDALKGSRKERTVIVDRSSHSFSPGLHTWTYAKIPTVGYISTPAYFLAEAPNGHIDKMSADLFYDQVVTLTRAVRELDKAPKELLRPA